MLDTLTGSALSSINLQSLNSARIQVLGLAKCHAMLGFCKPWTDGDCEPMLAHPSASPS